jgi:hypothetical protein
VQSRGSKRVKTVTNEQGPSQDTPESVTFNYMTATEYALIELAQWEKALREQQDAETQLAAAYRSGRPHDCHELLNHVEALRTRADLLLAEAVEVKCSLRWRDASDTVPF